MAFFMISIIFVGESIIIPIACSIIVLAGVISCCVLVLWHRRQMKKMQQPARHETQPLQQLTNNEKQDSVRVLKKQPSGVDKDSSTRKTLGAELLGVDLEKYEKDNKRTTSELNVMRQTTPSKTPKTKNVNVEISLAQKRPPKRAGREFAV